MKSETSIPTDIIERIENDLRNSIFIFDEKGTDDRLDGFTPIHMVVNGNEYRLFVESTSAGVFLADFWSGSIDRTVVVL